MACLLLVPVAMEGCLAFFGHQRFEEFRHVKFNPKIERSQIADRNFEARFRRSGKSRWRCPCLLTRGTSRR